MDIRGSEVQDFLRCRKRWDYKWKQELIPKKRNNKLLFGSLFHKYLENLYKTKNHEKSQQIMLQELNDNFDVELEMEDMEDKLLNISNHYYEKYKSDFLSMNIIGVEVQFSVPLKNGINFTGTIDLIYKDPEGNLWFSDHKTTNSLEKYEKNAILDRQINRYWWAIQQLAEGNGQVLNYENLKLENPYGFMYNIIYKDYPVAPKVLKSGGLSKDKNQKTTYEMYIQAIKDNNLPLSEYTDILGHLSSQGDRFFSRITVHRNQNEIEATMSDVKEIVVDMETAKVYRNITTDCQWDCQYKDLCLAEIDGSDGQWLKDELYERGEKENESND